MKNSGNIIIGILGAAAAGVVIGMILAPKSGKDLRKDIMDSANDATQRLGKLVSKGKEKYDELRSILSEEIDESKDMVADLISQESKKLKG